MWLAQIIAQINGNTGCQLKSYSLLEQYPKSCFCSGNNHLKEKNVKKKYPIVQIRLDTAYYVRTVQQISFLIMRTKVGNISGAHRICYSTV